MGELLSRINSPSDLKKFNIEELERLSAEIREEIINVVSTNGGHLASNLGVVELTIAIHYVFNAPYDKIIWDVGHQSYAHKLLTDRKSVFKTLRRYKGISGFTRREESIFDPYGAGHSSTSISAGLGIVEALRLKGDDSRVIAVIGDGSMTAGLSFEGLNQAGHLKKDIIVILNDNEMSISSNVGALSSFLSRKLTGKFFVKLKKDIELFLRSLPSGENMYWVAKRAEEAIKGFFTPGMLFEALGFSYVGPINGHKIKELLETFENIKDIKKPIFVHVLTKKGKGYPIAEDNPSKFHGTGPFDIKTGKAIAKSTKPSYTEIFGKTLLRLAKENDKIIAITAAMCNGTGLDDFAKELPDRFYDVGIAEQHAITFAAGLATEGFIPVAAIYSTFLQRAYDQIVHDICLQKLPVVFAIDRGGIVGSDGATHQGIFDYSYLRHIPNIIVMSPKDENELQHMIKTAIYAKAPISIRYPRGAGTGVSLDKDLKIIEIGKGELLREGRDVLILAVGSSVYEGLKAAEELCKEGIECALINARFVKPLDRELICSLSNKIGKIVTIEENVVHGGFGSAVLELFAENGLNNIKIRNIGIPDIFVEHGSQDILRNKYGIDYIGIIKAIKEIL